MRPLNCQLRLQQSAYIACLCLFFIVTGCTSGESPQAMAQQAMEIESGDECHLCGMIIENHPGPKGQLYEQGLSRVEKFCSTRDLFTYLLDPEHRYNVQSVFVHDMARTPWEHPEDDAFIDARQAWYVLGHQRTGAMGPTIASFAEQATARAFAERYGGHLYRFEELTLDLIQTL